LKTEEEDPKVKTITQIIAQALVDAPELVDVTVIESGHTSIVRLQVGQGEAGKIIGRQGRTVSAFRAILDAIAGKQKRRVILEVANDAVPSTKSMPEQQVIRSAPKPIAIIKRRPCSSRLHQTAQAVNA
jgi:predicted RNA-binding protein YlqC (UPF0109 family)